MVWQPINLTEVCPPSTSLTACSSFGHIYLGMVLQLFGGSVDKKKQDACDRERGSDFYMKKEYDFIVVGAGAAGCVVANRLTENPKWEVLLLEAGPEEPDVTSVPGISTVMLGSNIDWQFSTEPNGKSCLAYGGRCSLSQGKTMGGSSAVNSLSYIRGNRIDYDLWASLGNEGWSYEDVLPFFRKSERNINEEVLDSKYHGAKGEQFVSRYPYIDEPSIMLTEAFNQAGLPVNDYNGAEQIGTQQAQATSLDGQRVSTNVAFIRSIRHQRPNLHIQTNSQAIKILINKNNNAYGIVYIKNGKKYKAYASKEVIISAGVFNSPKLLMLSGVGPRKHLENLGIPVIKDLPVGKNLHDHVSLNGILIALSNKTATTVTREETLNAIKDYAKMEFKRGPLSANGPVNSISFLQTEPDLIAPDIQYQVNDISNWREVVEDPLTSDSISILPTAFYNGLTARVMNLIPKSRGNVSLNSSDPSCPPLINMNYLEDEGDYEPLLRGIRFLLTLENTEAFKSREAYFIRDKLPLCKHYEWGTDEYFICLAKHYTSTTYHPGGSCKMAPKNDKTAVLDNELRVYGINWLRVIDASMMPHVVRGNTNAPTIMIGERGADFIIKYWRSRTKNHC